MADRTYNDGYKEGLEKGVKIANEVHEEAARWWHDHMKLAEIVRWLVDNGELDDMSRPTGQSADRIIELLESPWKWDAEYEEMRAEEAKSK